mmetsp:Transcript_42827/g.99465  ORF Transcript_42827/g.99465 Transcript_42827/m.99465 type:complete len:233 (+) Transcript_42827:833-1531(+)
MSSKTSPLLQPESLAPSLPLAPSISCSRLRLAPCPTPPPPPIFAQRQRRGSLSTSKTFSRLLALPCLLVLPKLERLSGTKSRPGISFSVRGSLSRWRLNILSTTPTRRGQRHTRSGSTLATIGFWTLASSRISSTWTSTRRTSWPTMRAPAPMSHSSSPLDEASFWVSLLAAILTSQHTLLAPARRLSTMMLRQSASTSPTSLSHPLGWTDSSSPSFAPPMTRIRSGGRFAA